MSTHFQHILDDPDDMRLALSIMRDVCGETDCRNCPFFMGEREKFSLEHHVDFSACMFAKEGMANPYLWEGLD